MCSLISDQNSAATAAAAAMGRKGLYRQAKRGELMALIGDDWKLFWPRGSREINRKAHSAASMPLLCSQPVTNALFACKLNYIFHVAGPCSNKSIAHTPPRAVWLTNISVVGSLLSENELFKAWQKSSFIYRETTRRHCRLVFFYNFMAAPLSASLCYVRCHPLGGGNLTDLPATAAASSESPAPCRDARKRSAVKSSLGNENEGC